MNTLRLTLVLGLFVGISLADPPDELTAEQAAKQNTDAWKKTLEAKINADPRLKALSNRYGYHFIHSKNLFKNDGLNWCAFSFIYNTGDESRHQGDVQLIFGHTAADLLEVNPRTTTSNQIIELGAHDFTKDFNPKAIDITAERTWLSTAKVREGSVYLIRVRDDVGNRFYALLQIFYVDPKGEYIGFFWRMLDSQKLGLPEDKVNRKNDQKG